MLPLPKYRALNRKTLAPPARYGIRGTVS